MKSVFIIFFIFFAYLFVFSLRVQAQSYISPTPNPLCLCSNDSCSTVCTFDKYTDVTYHSPIKCSRELNTVGPTPDAPMKTNYCQRIQRTLGDVDGVNGVTSDDYFYYVSAVNGGGIPAFVNADANGDGLASIDDRAIIVRSLGTTLTTTPGTTATPTTPPGVPTNTPQPTQTPRPTQPPPPTATPVVCYTHPAWNGPSANPPCTVPGGTACADWGGSCYQGWTEQLWQQCQTLCSSGVTTTSCTSDYQCTPGKYCNNGRCSWCGAVQGCTECINGNQCGGGGCPAGNDIRYCHTCNDHQCESALLCLPIGASCSSAGYLPGACENHPEACQ